MVAGVTKGFEKKLGLVGVGYRAQAQGDRLQPDAGFLAPGGAPMPKGIKGRDADADRDVISGVDKQLVGQVAAEVRAHRSPSPTRARACATATRSSC